MNVNDFNDIQIPEGDMLVIIFNHQRDLMDKYHDIEEKNVGHRIPAGSHFCKETCRSWRYAGSLDINDRHSQLRLKDFAWRIAEELTEATEAYHKGDNTHFLEELIDALHFSVELCCLCGIEPEFLIDSTSDDKLDLLFGIANHYSPTDIRIRVYHVIQSLGDAMNMLKLKPWKTTAMLTDVYRFKYEIRNFFQLLIVLLSVAGLDARGTCLMYLKKNAVNQFRQRSAY